MEAFVQAVEGSAINEWVLSGQWTWPILEILHFMGLSLLLGSLLVIDLRMAGYFRQINVVATHKLLPWTFLGFGINLVTGFLFLVEDDPGGCRRTERALVLGQDQPGDEYLGAARRYARHRQGHRLDIAGHVVWRPAAGSADPLHRHGLAITHPFTSVWRRCRAA